MRKIVVKLLIIASLIIGYKIYMMEQRQIYSITENVSITIWHNYVFFGQYKSLFRPNNTSMDYIQFSSLYVTICMEDSTHIVIYTSEDPYKIHTKNRKIKNYSGEQQEKEFLTYCQTFLNSKPLCQIDLCAERGIFVPYIDVYSDSTYTRRAYGFNRFFQKEPEAYVCHGSIRKRIEANQRAIERWDRIQRARVKK